MTSTLLPSATLATASATVATVTVTAPAEPVKGLFLTSTWGCLSMVDLLLVILGLWTMLMVGFNRLSLITVIVPAGAAIGNGLLWLEIDQTNRGVESLYPFNWVMKNLSWVLLEHLGANFYTYFILQHLLSAAAPGRWRVYFYGFWLMVIGELVTSFIELYAQWKDYYLMASQYIHNLSRDALPATYMCLAGLEIWGAIFLLHKLYEGRKNSKKASGINTARLANLLNQLAFSTEIRLCTLASVGIIRSATGWTWFTYSPSAQWDVVSQIDIFGVIIENMYPMLLIMDLLAARIHGGPASKIGGSKRRPSDLPDLDIREGGNPSVAVASIGGSGGQKKGASPGLFGQTIDSIRRDFGQYLGKGSRDTSSSGTALSQAYPAGSVSDLNSKDVGIVKVESDADTV